MRCHYEVLGVDREADDGEIKNAYRKLALKWHPDKNLDNVDEAKEQFQLVQQAYDVLSDRNERAWYDSHRDQFVYGSNYEDSSLDVFAFFTTTCFKGYQDDEGGFYSVYRTVFENLAKEEMEFLSKDDYVAIPSFGDSKSDYSTTVAEFYAYWSCFTTKKSYAWLDPYETNSKYKKYSKLCEKENNKVRLKARKERNEEVRNLVSFIRKRDPRVKAYNKQIEVKKAENRLKQEQRSKEKRLENLKLNEAAAQAEWTKFDNIKSELEEIERNLAEEFDEKLSDHEENELEDTLYCVACNKIFKSSKAFQNHESSKKHKENVDLIKSEMLEDEESSFSEEFEEEIVKSKKKKKKAKPVLEAEPELEILALNDSDESFEAPQKKKKAKRKPKANNKTEPKDLEKPLEEIKELKEDKKEETKGIDVHQSCITCKSTFPSKNKLFDHLKKTGHGVYLPKDVKKDCKKSKKSIK